MIFKEKYFLKFGTMKREKNEEKGEIFTVPEGKSIILEKGGGEKILYFRQYIHPWVLINRV